MDAKAPSTLDYFPELPRTDSSAIAWYTLIAPFFVLLIVAFFSRDLAWPAALLVAGVMIWRRRKAKMKPHAVLLISDGRLLVFDRNGNTRLTAPLEEITNVALDTKTVEKVQENLSSGVPELRFLQSRVGPSLDYSRIEIQRGSESILLTEHYTSNIDASEWFAKIRRMLRKHGWVPLSERALDSASTDSSNH